jgi:hypothetical protein
MVVARARYYRSTCLERQGKTIKPLSQDSWYPAQDSNHAPPEYKHTALSLDQHIQMLMINIFCYWLGYPKLWNLNAFYTIREQNVEVNNKLKILTYECYLI